MVKFASRIVSGRGGAVENKFVLAGLIFGAYKCFARRRQEVPRDRNCKETKSEKIASPVDRSLEERPKSDSASYALRLKPPSMGMDPELEEEARTLVQSTLKFVSEVLAGEDEIPEAAELRARGRQIEDCHKKTEELLAKDPSAALKLALQMVEMLLFLTVKTELAGQCATSSYLTSQRQQSIMSRIGEVLWTVKDALELARDLEDFSTSLKSFCKLAAFATAELSSKRLCGIISRVKEPDAPMAAVTEASKEAEHARLHAEILFVLGDAQLSKALKSPFSQAREEALEAAAATMREATELYDKLGDTKWKGRAMLGTALALVGLEDEDQQMDGERLAEDAKEHWM
eukprot:Skav218187  [mRNA]  locus=scaffold5213:249859:255761:- [translate_table: standard]